MTNMRIIPLISRNTGFGHTDTIADAERAMHRPAQIRPLPGGGSQPEGRHAGRVSTQQLGLHGSFPSGDGTAPLAHCIGPGFIRRAIRVAQSYLLLEPVGFQTEEETQSILHQRVSAPSESLPAAVRTCHARVNFPAWHRVYDVLPMFSATSCRLVAEPACLTSIFGGERTSVSRTWTLTSNALRVGASLGRYSDFIHAYIDRRTPLPDRSFDVVLFARSFHHVRNHRKALRRMRTTASRRGHLIIADPVMLHENGRIRD